MTPFGERDYSEIPPKEAVGIVLPAPGIRGPLNEEGQVCPWPWLIGGLPRQGKTFAQRLVIAGVPHLDYRESRAG
jgi:hypothetical protein